MKNKLFLPFLFIFFAITNANAQYPGYYFSGIFCSVQNKNDSAFLINNELEIWKAAVKGGVEMFDNPMMDIEFKVKMSKVQIEDCFKDSFPSKSATTHYQMNLMENRNADTCYIMSFSPYVKTRFQKQTWVFDSTRVFGRDTASNGNRTSFSQVYGHQQAGAWVEGTSLRFLIPASEYSKILPYSDLNRFHNYCLFQFSNLLGGKLSGDTTYRIARFTCDSNEYLPQAPYQNILETLMNEMLARKIHAFLNKNLLKSMSKNEIENTCVGWDSTNNVEDPNNPGVFIFAPIKYEGQVKSFLIYERWIPFFQQFKYAPYYSCPPQPFICMKREVIAYGMYLTNGKTIWFSPEEVKKDLLRENFDTTPYEESFRAERFQTLQIRFD